MNITNFLVGWERYSGSVAPDDAMVLEWVNLIEDELRDDLIGVFSEKFMQPDTISVVSGTTSYALPADFDNMTAQHTQIVDGTSKWDESEYGSSSQGFWFSDTLNITPEPQSAKTLIMRYVPTRTQYTDFNDTLFLTDRDIKFYYDAFSQLFNTRERNWEEANVSQQLKTEGLSRIVKNYAPTPNIIDASLPNVY